MERRVAVTGCGALCGLGNSVPEISAALRGGRSGVRLIAAEPAGPAVAGASPLLGGAYADLHAKDRALGDPVTRFALLAAQEALSQSGLLSASALRDSAAVYVGTAMGGMYTIDEAYRNMWCRGASPKPLSIVCAMSHAPAAQLSIRFGLRGPSLTFAIACASSAVAIGEAFQAIRAGRIGCALAGGTEACLTEGVLRAWQAMRVLAPAEPHAPAQACRPFSRDRAGIVLGEGAAMLVLEPLEAAVSRGARVLCELLGFACTSDAAHVCNPCPGGQSAAMRDALADARLTPREIDYINAHGTGTQVGDLAETRAIREAFGDHARQVPVSSTKSVHGHLLGAAGALELIVGIIALREGFLPATMHLREPDPGCDLDYVPNQPRAGTRIRMFMSSSFAFGGTNAVIVAGEAR